MRRQPLLTLVVLFTQVTLASAQSKPQTEIERLRQQQAIEEALESLNRLEVLTDSISKTKHLKCMMAVGSQPFCDCLRDQLPVGASFENYISITTQSKDELGYAKLDQEWKGVVDTTLKVRESCVAKSFRR